MKHLYRSETNKIFAGVLGGIGEYFTIDPVIVRLIYISFTVITGFLPGILTYLVAIFIVPPSVSKGGAIDVEIIDDKSGEGS